MCLVTFLPRLLPFLSPFTLPGWTKKWLDYIPYAALGALIFPGILSVYMGKPWVGLSSGLAAGLLALFTRNVTVIVLVAIAFCWGIQHFLL